MLNPQDLENIAAYMQEIFFELQGKIMVDIAKRVSLFDYEGNNREFQALEEQGLADSQNYIAQEITRTLRTSAKKIRELYKESGLKCLEEGGKTRDEVIKAGKLGGDINFDNKELLAQYLDEGATRTLKTLKELCQSILRDAFAKLYYCLEQCRLLIGSNAYGKEQAIELVVRNFAEQGVGYIDYRSKDTSSIEAAVERITVTGLNQAIGKISLEIAAILQTDLVQVSGHADARPEHALWQYGIYSISGESTKYRKLSEATGYGTGAGLCGWNCRHSFFPYIEGVTDKMKQGDYDPAIYEAEQKLRYYERQIRQWRRRAETLAAAGIDNATEMAKVAYWQDLRYTLAQGLDKAVNIVFGDNLPYNGIRESISELGDTLRQESRNGNEANADESNDKWVITTDEITDWLVDIGTKIGEAFNALNEKSGLTEVGEKIGKILNSVVEEDIDPDLEKVAEKVAEFLTPEDDSLLAALGSTGKAVVLAAVACGLMLAAAEVGAIGAVPASMGRLVSSLSPRGAAAVAGVAKSVLLRYMMDSSEGKTSSFDEYFISALFGAGWAYRLNTSPVNMDVNRSIVKSELGLGYLP